MTFPGNDDDAVRDAISHCGDVSESCGNAGCSRDHSQLADWLKELIELRQIARNAKGPEWRTRETIVRDAHAAVMDFDRRMETAAR